MKKGIVGILHNTPRLDLTHPAGWTYIIRDILFKGADILTERDDWTTYDQLLICHSLNYKEGDYNIIGGIDKRHYKRIDMIYNFEGDLFSVDDFDIKDYIKKRDLYYSFDKEWIYEKLTLPKKDKIVLGDSHSLSVWPNDQYEIKRLDGKTLHGYLKDPLDLSRYEDVILYFGNIDIRFHLCRQPNPLRSAVELFERYIDYAKKYNATITNLLPIENENRKIPKSGQYKGQNFFGTREQRQTLVNIVNDLMDKSGLNVITWPKEWYDNINYYQQQIMERTQSVHLKPRYYKKNIQSEQVSLF
jgi:hypothetical protein